MPFSIYSGATKRNDKNSTKFLYFFIYLNDHAILELRIIVKFIFPSINATADVFIF